MGPPWRIRVLWRVVPERERLEHVVEKVAPLLAALRAAVVLVR